MLSCREATRLVSQAQERKLDLSQRLQLRFHHAICAACANYARQIDFLRLACRRYADSAKPDDKHPK